MKVQILPATARFPRCLSPFAFGAAGYAAPMRYLPALFTLFVPICAAVAHPFLQNAMWVKELQVAQETAQPESVAAEKHGAYLCAHLELKAAGQTLAGRVTKRTPPPEVAEPEKTFYQYELDYPLAGPPPAQITFSQSMLREFPYAVGTAWDVSYVVRMKRSDSLEISSALLPARRPADFPTGWGSPSAQVSAAVRVEGWRTFGGYLHHGVMHILTGYDHLLFVSALVLATLSFWEMAKVVAAFTLAHTITLTLAVFSAAFRLPTWIVEPAIAASIVFVAVENIFWPGRTHSRLRLAVAFGFGLIHGLGFAGGLIEAMAGLPALGTWIALTGFSLGVELGHLAAVLPLFALLALGRKTLRDGFAHPVVRYGSALISVAGGYYLFISVHEQFFTH